MSEIPQWAFERAAKLVNAEPGRGRGRYDAAGMAVYDAGRALARYISEHEEPPVDPLVLEMRTIASIPPWGNSVGHRAQIISSGRGDHYFEAQLILAALRRGIEIGKEASDV